MLGCDEFVLLNHQFKYREQLNMGKKVCFPILRGWWMVVCASGFLISVGNVAHAAEGGFALMQQSDCLSCHAVDRKIVGPAFSWIAYRYKGDNSAPDKLARKIRSGGAGNWTSLTGGMPMPAHPQLTAAQAKVLAEWVLKQKPAKAPNF